MGESIAPVPVNEAGAERPSALVVSLANVYR